MAPKTVPTPRNEPASSRTPGEARADARRAPGTCGWRAGAVRRWAAKARPPTTVSAASAISPAAGATVVAMAVASTGPTTKVNSSVTDSKAKAVFSFCGEASGESPDSLATQRDRTIAPICGTLAPAGAAARNSVQTGACPRASAISAPTDRACTATLGTSTAACPNRSASRPVCGPTKACATAETAATAPAVPYEPWVSKTSSTMPRLSIAYGSRAARAGTRNVQARGVRSSAP